MLSLRPYQQDCLATIAQSLEEGISKQLIVIPTGGGKTVVFSQLPMQYPGRMLVIAHREELLNQAKEKILWANPDLVVEIEQATHHATPDADVVVASVATLGRKESKRLRKFPRDHFSTVVIDEAHHCSSRNASYMRILDHFDDYTLRLGVTATPQRGDNTTLIGVFDQITFHITMEDLIDQGYLVDLVGHRIVTKTDISGVSTRAGDYAVGQLSEAVNTPYRNKVAVEAYQAHLEGKRAIVFCVDVQHTKDMYQTFADMGIPSAYVIGTTSSDDRQRFHKAFSDGSLKVLTSCGVHLEGYDEPTIEGILFARPTRSNLLFTQAVGRGLRLSEGKTHCTVLDLVDVIRGKRLVGLPTLMGLPPDFDTQGSKLTEVAKAFRKLEEASPAEAARVRSMDDIDVSWEQIDLFRPPPRPEELDELTPLVWGQTHPDTFVLLLESERFIIARNALGTWDITHRDSKRERVVHTCPNMAQAFKLCDEFIKRNRSEQLRLLDTTAKWRKQKPTDKQLKALRRLRVPIPADMDRGMASQILSHLYAKK